jgi:hypothetical protein
MASWLALRSALHDRRRGVLVIDEAVGSGLRAACVA